MIDILFFFLVLMAIIKGYRQGFIVAVFSFVALLVGLVAAMKLSVVAASYLADSTNISARWLPVISFAAVFLAVVILIRFASALVQKAAEAVMLGWLNRVAGMVLYIGIYTVVFSVVLFYADKIHLLNSNAQASSFTYAYIRPFGPAVIEAIGFVVPVFKNMFHELEVFFEKIGR
ncbi:MAG: CvpA family protein [Williamsia sp.]|nr:CvpA family protein [Williamsia sp.]